MADGKLIFETKLDNSGLTKDTKQLEREVKQLEKDLAKIQSKKVKMEFVDLDRAKSELAELEESLREINNMKAEGVYAQNSNMNYASDVQSIQELIQAKQEEVRKGQEYEAVCQQEAYLKAQIVAKNEELAQSNKKVSSTVETLKKALKIASNSAKSFVSAMTSAFSRKTGIDGFIKKMTNSLTSLGRMLKTRLKRLFVSEIFNIIKSSFTALTQYSSTLGEMVGNMSASFTNLGANIVGAFAPILEAVIPIITQLVEWLNIGINAIAKFFAMLTGKNTITKAVKQQKQYADSVGASAKANQKLLASFDEINQLNKSDSSGGGSDSGTVEYEKVGFEPWKELQDALNSGDWEAVGRLFAEKINKIVDNIDFSGIGAKIGKTLEKGVEFAFGFLSNIDTGNMGTGIADLLVSMFSNIDFNKLGQSLVLIGTRIADFFRELFNPSNELGTTIGESFGNLLNGIITQLPQFISSLGKGLSNLAVSIGKAIVSALKTIDLSGIGINLEPLAKSFEGLVERIKPFLEMIGETIGNIFDNYIFPLASVLLEDILPPIISLISEIMNVITLLMDNIINPILELLSAVLMPIINAIGEYIGGIIQAIATGLGDLMTSLAPILEIIQQFFNDYLIPLWENFLSPVFEAILTFLLDNVIKAITVVIQKITSVISIITSLIQGIIAVIRNVVEVGKQLFNNFLSFFSETFTPIFEGAWTGIKDFICGIWNGIASTIESVINFLIDCLNSISFDIPEWVPVIGGEHWGLNIPHVHIPRLATGTVIPPNASQFLAILGDNNNDTEVVSPLETIKEALTEVMATNNSNQNITINFTGNLSQLARILKPEIEKEEKRIGRSLIVSNS